MEKFEILKETEKVNKNVNEFIKAAENHLGKTFEPLKKNTVGLVGEKFVDKFVSSFRVTGSPIVINLDHNVSEKQLDESEKIVKELETIVESTAGHVSGYKMNFQSLLTFLIAKRPNFVQEIKDRFKAKTNIEPVVWLDQKLGDIPNTNFQAADILYKLGFDAVHALPQIGPDCVGAVQLAAERNGMVGVVHVINMTHDGYKTAKEDYFKKELIDKLRGRALGNYIYPVKIGKEATNVKIRAIGTIEPANRPYELFDGYRRIYNDKIMIISIGIGTQGALPGSALYAGATCEGIGRFIFSGERGIDNAENIEKKADLCKQCALLALSAKYSNEPYPLREILDILKDFNPVISEKTKEDLDLIYHDRKK
ncbi:MAG: orotidine 5'-phosphate decarboxylase [Methanophagales archaeon]|nr:orotidine 5'-phosphate decarboxylase [Methanophagales archaeon]